MNARVHQSVPRGHSHGTLVRIPRLVRTPRTPLPRAIKELLGGMTRKELAQRTGLSEAAVSLLCRGGRRKHMASTIKAVAEALGKTMEQVMTALDAAAEQRSGSRKAKELLDRVRRGGLE